MSLQLDVCEAQRSMFVPQKHKKRSMKKSPLGRFMRPVAKADMARVNKAKVLFLLYECYEKKMVAESEWADDMVSGSSW